MSEITNFTVPAHGRSLIETCINDLKLMRENVRHQRGAATPGYTPERREAVIILYASGMVSVTEGWGVKEDDIPELLAAKVLRGT